MAHNTYDYLNSNQHKIPASLKGVRASGMLSSVAESKDMLFSSDLLPHPPPFAFQERGGKIDWRFVVSTDVDKVAREVDLVSLETILQNLTYASLSKEEFQTRSDLHFIKLFKLSQLSIEYLVYTQGYLEVLTKSLDWKYKQLSDSTRDIRDAYKKCKGENRALKHELLQKTKVIETYEYLMKMQKDQANEAVGAYHKCQHCVKFFVSRDFLRKHYAKQHREVDFERNCPEDPVSLASTRPNANQAAAKPGPAVVAEQNQDEMFNRISGDIQNQLKGTLQKLQSSISDIQSRQSSMSTLNSTWSTDQGKLDQTIQRSNRMIEELQQQMGDLMSTKTQGLQDFVSTTVKEALGQRGGLTTPARGSRNAMNNGFEGGDMSTLEPESEIKPMRATRIFEEKLEEQEMRFKEQQLEIQSLIQQLSEVEVGKASAASVNEEFETQINNYQAANKKLSEEKTAAQSQVTELNGKLQAKMVEMTKLETQAQDAIDKAQSNEIKASEAKAAAQAIENEAAAAAASEKAKQEKILIDQEKAEIEKREQLKAQKEIEIRQAEQAKLDAQEAETIRIQKQKDDLQKKEDQVAAQKIADEQERVQWEKDERQKRLDAKAKMEAQKLKDEEAADAALILEEELALKWKADLQAAAALAMKSQLKADEEAAAQKLIDEEEIEQLEKEEAKAEMEAKQRPDKVLSGSNSLSRATNSKSMNSAESQDSALSGSLAPRTHSERHQPSPITGNKMDNAAREIMKALNRKDTLYTSTQCQVKSIFEHSFEKVCKQKKGAEAEIKDEIVILAREIMEAGSIKPSKERVIAPEYMDPSVQKVIIPEILYMDTKSLSAMKRAVQQHIDSARREEQEAGQPDYLKFIEDNIEAMMEVHNTPRK